MEKMIRSCRWHFIRIAEESSKSGVRQTPQEAIAGALKLTLRCVSERFNVATVGHIQLKEYPWFVLAKVTVYPYQIQRSAILSVSDEPTSLWMPPPIKVVITGNQVAPTVY
jgi:hypothetical protein